MVFDIDGVVADVQHRLHHLEQPRKDWAAFFAAAADDPPLVQGIERARRASEDAELVWVTGRPESLRETTLAWLEATGLPVQRLIMRAGRDFRPARVVKREALRRLSRTMNIIGVVDDDPEVCAALAAEGYPVEQAGWAAYTQPLRTAQEHRGRT